MSNAQDSGPIDPFEPTRSFDGLCAAIKACDEERVEFLIGELSSRGFRITLGPKIFRYGDVDEVPYMESALPCPFCGYPPHVTRLKRIGKRAEVLAGEPDLWMIRCQSLACRANPLVCAKKEEAMWRWNTRAGS